MKRIKITKKTILIASAVVLVAAGTMGMMIAQGATMPHTDQPVANQEQVVELAEEKQPEKPVEAVQAPQAVQQQSTPARQETPVVEAPADPDAALWESYRYDEAKIACIKRFMAEHPKYFSTPESKKGRLNQIHGSTAGNPCRLYEAQ